MSVKFQRERIDEFLGDASKFMHEHLAEASDIPVDKIDLDFDSYTALEHSNNLHIITGRNEHGQLVAYWIGLILYHSHNRTTLSSFDDSYWVRPDYRGITVLRLYKYLEDYFEKLGVKRSYHITKPGKNRLDGIIAKLGYRKVEELYLKVRD